MSSRTPVTRRTMLRGLGAAVGLPLLEAMWPRRARGDDSPPTAPLRNVFIYKPGGCVMPAWTPEAVGPDFELSPTLAPLANVKDQVLVLSGLDSRTGEKGNNGHPLGCAPWLSTAPLNEKDRGGYSTAISIDQLIAQRIGDQTRLASLELGCAHSANQIHISNISWRGPSSPMGKETKPRAVFTRLFGDPRGDRYQRSILDAVLDDARSVRERLGVADRHKLDEYLDSLRAVERRIQIAEAKTPPGPPPQIDLPDGIPDDYPRHLELMADLIVLALRSDCTRVITFMLENEDQIPSMPHLNVPESHHTLVHNDSRPGKPITNPEVQEQVDKLQRVDRYFVSILARVVEQLRNSPEADGSVLDHSTVLFGSGLSWGNLHSRADLPLVMAGGCCGQVRTGRHLRCPAGTPVANLHLSLLAAHEILPDRVADSTGLLKQLS